MKVADEADLNIFFSNEKNKAENLDDKDVKINNNQLIKCVSNYLAISN